MSRGLSKLSAIAFVCFVVSTLVAQEPAPVAKPLFSYQEVMIPMRDGIRLQTVILAPADQSRPLPILFRRTPYGVPDKAPAEMPPSWKELAQDGYIFVIQNLRGRFKSEGLFKLVIACESERSERDERDDRRIRQHRVAGEECAEQQRQGGHVWRVLRRPDDGYDASASASRR